MSDGKQGLPGGGEDDVDWADALDEWEQKAFSNAPAPVSPSVSPPKVSSPVASRPVSPPQAGVPSPPPVARAHQAIVVEVPIDAESEERLEVDADDLVDIEIDVGVATSAPPGLSDLSPNLPPRVRVTEERRARPAREPALPSRPPAPLHSRVPVPPAPQLEAEIAALLEEQALWLEAEAAAGQPVVRAQTLLALSEIHAILGDRERGHGLAVQARDLAPELVLAHKQARTLAGGEEAASSEALALIAEEANAPSAAAKLHAAILAADALRLGGDTEGALIKLTRVADTGDIRGLIGRVALSLAQGDTEDLATFVTRKEAMPIAEGLSAALRLRGAAVASPSGEAPSSAETVTATLKSAREALRSGDTLGAARSVSHLRAIPELAPGAAWLGSALATTKDEGRPEALAWLGQLAQSGEQRASRVLAARAIEADDGAAAAAALKLPGFSTADEIALSALLELDADASEDIAALAPEMRPLAAAVAAMEAAPDTRENEASRAARVGARANRVVGPPEARAAIRLGRLFAADAPVLQLQAALTEVRATAPIEAGALEMELARRIGAFGDVSDLLRAWAEGDVPLGRVTDPALAGALIAERAGDPARAISAYREARALDPSSEVALRAIAALHSATDLPGELNDLAGELGATPQGALARLEAVIREDSVDDVTRIDLLERAHQAAPSLPLAAGLMERIALRNGRVDDVLRWIEERRASGPDPTQLVVDLVREARFMGGQDHDASVAKLGEAHKRMPGDLALRELYERSVGAPLPDGTAFWEAAAAKTTGDARTVLFILAAYEYERIGDAAGALRAAQAAAGEDTPLARLCRDRAELVAGEAARLVDELLTEAKATDSTVRRREAYERLADIDGGTKGDPASALLWHQAILEETPGYLPSLRHVEHALITEGRDEELEHVVSALAHALHGSGGGEAVAHADLAARLRARGATSNWDATRDLAELAATDPNPSIASLRLLQAHARIRKDDDVLVSTTEQLLARATRPVEMAALRLRLAEAAFRQSDLAEALTNLERGAAEDPGDLVGFRLLAEVRQASGDGALAAEAHEAIARLSLVASHQLEAWYDAAKLWLDEANEPERGVQALEQAAAIDLTYEDVFSRLSALYSNKGDHIELAGLLERRIVIATDPDERVTLEVDRARALLASGDRQAARAAISLALEQRPGHATALATFAELSALEEDWAAAEDAWVRLARLLSEPDEQREVYRRLGELYSTKLLHLERAELAYREVLKRAPGEVVTMQRLVDVHRRQLDVARAAEVQQELIALATTPAEKRDRIIALAGIYEDPGHDERKAEQVLDGARREFATDVVLLRALAEFYLRHRQTPAMNILLDRAVADARRGFAAGRFSSGLFEIMQGVFDLRERHDASRVVGAGLLDMQGKPADLRGAYGPALDPRLDDLLAPDALGPGMRALLKAAGAALDAAAPIDLRAIAAAPIGTDGRMIQELCGSFAAGLGLEAPRIFVSRTVGRTCLPAASSPPAIVVGESLLSTTDERAVVFILMRAMKLVAAHASALVRTTSTELAVLVPAWLQAIVPSWTPQGVNPGALAAAARKIAPGLATMSPQVKDQLGALGLEVASQLGTRASTLGGLALAWADRAALLGVGDPNAALSALAWSLGAKDGAPTEPQARIAWIGRTHEVKDLLIFSIGDAYAEARTRLALDQ